MIEPLAAMASSVAALATREIPAPHYEFHAGDTHVAAPEIHNHVAASPAPVVQQDIHVAPSPAPVVDNHVDMHVDMHVDNHVDVHVAAPEDRKDSVQKMEIVAITGLSIESMPDRVTTSEIDRDPATKEIIKTTQTEKDRKG